MARDAQQGASKPAVSGVSCVIPRAASSDVPIVMSMGVSAPQPEHVPAHVLRGADVPRTCGRVSSWCRVDFRLDATEFVERRDCFLGDTIHEVAGGCEDRGDDVRVDRDELRVTGGLHPQLRRLG